jgi:DNA-binding LacI/PurR family transcriptional regulator
MEKKKSTSLKDIASVLGVSVATVSRALQNNTAISEQTREKVQKLATELDYRPNFLATSLRHDSIPMIGVVVPHGVTLFYSSVIDGIESIAAQNGYAVITMNSHESYEEERYNVESLAHLHVAGIIASVTQETQDYSHFEALVRDGIPLVFVARDLPDTSSYSSVVADSPEAAYRATLHLLDNGCRRVGLLGGPNSLNMVKQRKHGYINALHERRITVEPQLVICDKINMEQGLMNTERLLALPEPPDGILALNDTLLFSAMKAIKKHHLRIPEDVALIGFTDVDYAEDVTPPISAIMDQSYKMGEAACKILVGHIRGVKKIVHKVVPTILKIRESSVRRKGNSQTDK